MLDTTYRLALWLTRREADARDLVQDTYLRALEARDTYRPGASMRAWLARILRNLKAIHRTAGDWPRLVAVLHRLVILLPHAWEERRDRGLALAELGHVAQAVDDLSVYLEHRHDADDHAVLTARVLELRDTGWPRLH